MKSIFFYLLLLMAVTFIIFYLKDYLYASRKVKIFKDSRGNYPYYFTPRRPVKWFDFTGLINSFKMVALSSDILSIIDKREVQTALGKDSGDELTDHDADESEKEFWFDFIADTGDGFDATTTVFFHLTRDTYTYSFKNEFDRDAGSEVEIRLKKGAALVVGGDLVYPVGSENSYRDRFKGPLRFVAPDRREPGPVLLATPGNHDWYDGLSAFFRLMCQKSKIGNYRTVQNRSYFAYSLRKNVHLLGVDNQLLGDIDIPQMAFFTEYVGKISRMNARNHIIMLIAEPYWYHYDIKDRYQRRQRMDSLEYIIKALKVAVKNLEVDNVKSEIIFDVVLTGDIHHYSHYKLDESFEGYDQEIKHYITSGGGGAFGHITDFLKDEITLPILQNSKTTELKYQLNGIYPSKEKSCRKTLWNLIFFIINYEFTFLLLVVSLIVTYTYAYSDSIFKWLILLLIPGLFVFIITKVTNAEVSAREKWTSLIFRGLLFLSSFALQILILVHELTFLSDDHFPFKGLDTVKNFLKIQGSDYFISQWIISAILQSVLFGWYIFSGYHLFKFYVTEVSSAKVNTGNKNFLKFKITDSEIVIYVVRIKKTYQWMKLLKKKRIDDLQKEMLGKDPKKFIREHFKTDPDKNVKIIDKITIPL
ncbi:metallophosphoesterase [Chryseobacterium arthrosphaerae]|uniref:metallophosphoesterase n=1 Tax=Chryseobacterium arthrosphaerae TaxID=651561 RepID=UPI001F4ADDF1|nr:metallophosphoesterase [Chryseobacterium arthrosphaerae]